MFLHVNHSVLIGVDQNELEFVELNICTYVKVLWRKQVVKKKIGILTGH